MKKKKNNNGKTCSDPYLEGQPQFSHNKAYELAKRIGCHINYGL